MSRHDLRPFGKTARRGSAYRTPGGHYWIVRVGAHAWHLIHVAQPERMRERQTIARTATLREAVEFYRTEVI